MNDHRSNKKKNYGLGVFTVTKKIQEYSFRMKDNNTVSVKWSSLIERT